jgi:hypothetical protein
MVRQGYRCLYMALVSFALLTLTASQTFAQPRLAQARESRSLDQGWLFQRGEVQGAETTGFQPRGWQAIALPHSFDGSDPDRGGAFYRGPAWYLRDLNLSRPASDQRAYLEFDGAALDTEVWLNGAEVGLHKGGFGRFRFDVTPYIRAGLNRLAVRVDNRLDPGATPLGGDFSLFGGLYRSARLVITHDLHLDMLDDGGPGAYFTASEVSPQSAALHWTVRVANDRDRAAPAQVVVRLYDAGGGLVSTLSRPVLVPAKAVAAIDLDGALAKPHLWDGRAEPYLYQAQVEIQGADGAPMDEIETAIGLRDLHFSPDRGLILNGRPYAVHGADYHQSQRPGEGPAVSRAEMDQDFQLLLDLGVTGLRLVHYQHPQRTYDLADQSGVLLWTEIPLNGVTNGSDALLDNTRQQLRELIKQNMNHPSVITWGLGNEIYKSDAASERLLDEMQKNAHALDPSRPTTYANCCGPANGPQASHTDLIGLNYYNGWYDGETVDFTPWAGKSHALIPQRPMAISEYGAGASVNQEADPPGRPQPKGRWHPEQYQALFHESYWRQIRALPYLWGSFVWVAFDTPSAGRDEGDRPGFNDKGLITYDRRTRKDAYFWYQANWSSKPMLYITSRRDTPRKGPVVAVKIYSNQSRIHLTLNGADLGEQPVVDHIALWAAVRLAPGPNHLEARADGAGDAAASDSVDWTVATVAGGS